MVMEVVGGGMIQNFSDWNILKILKENNAIFGNDSNFLFFF